MDRNGIIKRMVSRAKSMQVVCGFRIKTHLSPCRRVAGSTVQNHLPLKPTWRCFTMLFCLFCLCCTFLSLLYVTLPLGIHVVYSTRLLLHALSSHSAPWWLFYCHGWSIKYHWYMRQIQLHNTFLLLINDFKIAIKIFSRIVRTRKPQLQLLVTV